MMIELLDSGTLTGQHKAETDLFFMYSTLFWGFPISSSSPLLCFIRHTMVKHYQTARRTT